MTLTSNLRRRRLIRHSLFFTIFGAFVIVVNFGPAVRAYGDLMHYRLVTSPAYRAQYGFWSTFSIPKQYRVNAIHAALLHTGKVLIVAGSGNDEASFNAGTFKTLLWDPATDKFKLIPTPADLFCSGHAFLPDGRLLIAGGTQRYEKLNGAVTNAAGAVTIKNENPDAAPRTFKKGTRLSGPNGKVYQTTNDFVLPPASKMIMNGQVMVEASSVVVWAEALQAGPSSVITRSGQYKLLGLRGDDQHNIYGLADKMTLDKQDFQGLQQAYVFDPASEKYSRIDDMTYKRWYPTLVGLANGDILASSGLDGTGQVLNGQTEVLDHTTLKWTNRTDLSRYFPTYPSLFLMANGNLFYSGSNAGYGPADKGRDPGIWDVVDNTFRKVQGLRDGDLTETSGSVMLPPAQNQKVMLMGGGGVGESPLSTARTDIIDLKSENPAFTPGPNLAENTRYPNIVLLPDDNVLVTGGSKGYRGKFASDNLISKLYNPTTNSFRDAAAQSIGRDYHSEALLLPDGRVVTMGSNPLFSDKQNTQSAPFEQRLEIYTPPYLYHGDRPSITGGDDKLSRGQNGHITVNDTSKIAGARLMRPSAATHVTDVEQRSIALAVTKESATGLTLGVPDGAGLTPAGWYMLFVTDTNGVPSIAKWVYVNE